jgi:hypothetical protein
MKLHYGLPVTTPGYLRGTVFRLARSRSPKPSGFGAGEAQRKSGLTGWHVPEALRNDRLRGAEPGAGAKTRLTLRRTALALRLRAKQFFHHSPSSSCFPCALCVSAFSPSPAFPEASGC